MTRKDYVAIAAIVKEAREEMTGNTPDFDSVPSVLQDLDTLAARLADVFAADNPNFNRDRFMAATGVQND